ncbi:MAG: AmmeMemoRadiSam system protein B [Brevinematales bacterium]|nr:AmmeMemoRadiSam system protein B [Brevinematales bacterium]
MREVRRPAVANIFYPGDKINLKVMVNEFLAQVDERFIQEIGQKVGLPFALVSPHAGYVYSGQVAAYGYKLIENTNWDVVVLLGPSHYVHFEGVALSSAVSFQTPLGEIEVDSGYNAALIEEDPHLFSYLSVAHEREHCLETQLPFLQDVIEGEFRIVPMLLGVLSQSTISDIAQIVVNLYRRRNERVLFVISTDLSHYHTAKEAEEMDRRLIRHLLRMDTEALFKDAMSGVIEACGIFPLLVMCEMGKKLGRTQVKELCYRHSGEVSKDMRQVVGYLSAVVW